MKTFACSSLSFLLFWFSGYLRAASPVIERYQTYADFAAGKLHQISLSSDGRMALAPRLERLCNTGEPFIWALARDSKDNLYAATGNDGRVFKITSRGDTSLFFDAGELEVYAIAIDLQDRLYAATSPHGKIYRITRDGNHIPFYDPPDSYIWALLVDGAGDLWAATGGAAHLYRIKPDGSGQIVFTCEAEHLRCLISGPGNQIFFGSSKPGYVYRMAPDTKPFVLHDPEAEEVHALTRAADGTLYAAVFMENSAFLTAPQPPAMKSEEESDRAETNPSLDFTSTEEALSFDAKTALLMIDTDGHAKNLWSVDEAILSILAIDDDVLAGSGEDGRIYRISREGEASLLLELQETQTTCLLKGAGPIVYTATANMGCLYRLDPDRSVSGRYEAKVLDAGGLSQWGTLQWLGAEKVSYATRSGNTRKPENSWSDWEPVIFEKEVGRIKSPAARFIQWRCDLETHGGRGPQVEEVNLSYLQKNLPPEIHAINLHPSGEYLAAAGETSSMPGILTSETMPKGEEKQGYRSIDWQFSDPNGDALLFDLYCRRLPDGPWQPLAHKLAAFYYSWDTQQQSDGLYQIRIVASDSVKLPPGYGLLTSRISESFTIDNTGPDVKGFSKEQKGATQVLSFSICDAHTPLLRFEYSLNASGWLAIYPRDGLCDSKCEMFDLKLPTGSTRGEVTIRALDQYENYGVFHFTLTNEP